MQEQFKVYELKEVASILKINIRVLRRYIKENKIKASKIGRKYVITAEDLESYLKGNNNNNNNNNNTELNEQEKALLEYMLTKADAEANINIDLKEYIKITNNKKATEEDIEETLNNLLKYEAKTEMQKGDFFITGKSNLIGSYFKTSKGYEVELSKVLIEIFKANMLINTKIVKK